MARPKLNRLVDSDCKYLMSIGFTGTRHGLTDAQHATLRSRLQRCNPERTVAQHGSCIDADAEFDALCAEMGIHRTARPAYAPGHPLRAVLDCEITLPCKPPLVRNRDIVDAATVLLACPVSEIEMRFRIYNERIKTHSPSEAMQVALEWQPEK